MHEACDLVLANTNETVDEVEMSTNKFIIFAINVTR